MTLIKMQYDKNTEMSSDVERLLEVQESNDSERLSTDNSKQEKSGICANIYLYKMPQLTQEQLIGFSTKYKVNDMYKG